MVVAFSLMVHKADDERVASQEAQALRAVGDTVYVFSTYLMQKKSRTERCQWLQTQLEQTQPDVIICDTPISVLTARRAKKTMARSTGKHAKVLYDITEWYPSKKNLRNYGALMRIVRFFALTFLHLKASFLSDAFLMGEYYKALPCKILFPWKKKLLLTYYATNASVKKYAPKTSLKKSCAFYYSGNLTEEKGFFRVLEVARKVAENRPNTKFQLNVVSSMKMENLENSPSNLNVSFQGWMPFETFCETVGANDLFFDLRDDDIENTHCLPIKMFYYMAVGRPMIYSDLKAIRKGVSEIDEMGVLVKPTEIEKMVEAVLRYVDDDELYQKHCQNALRWAEEKYNWESIEESFVKFIHHGI